MRTDLSMQLLIETVAKARRLLPPWDEVASEAREVAEGITIGKTLFFEKYDVSSEAEYKRRAKQSDVIMTHAHIGLDTWKDTKAALLHIYEEMTKRGLRIDRFGLCLDRVMAYPPEIRDRVPRETGPQLRSSDEWMEVGQVVPIQPHAGDFMIGFPASMINAECALRAGITTIGNLSQYFGHGVPAWDDEVTTAVETAKAISLMGRLRDKGTLVHSYLDDGFGSLFNDYADVVGWAYLEKYIVEDLCNAKLAHCFGGVTADPLMRIAWVMIMREIHGEDCLGSMWYGDTISFSDDFNRNLGLNAEYLLWDIVGQLVCPTGHAVLPLPVTEAVRIPTAREIADVHVFGRRIEEAARRLAPQLNLKPAEAIRDTLVEHGKRVFERALLGMETHGVNTRNPLEVLYVLKKLGPEWFEREYGAGPSDPTWPRGRKPVWLTDMFARTLSMSETIVEGLPTGSRDRVLRVVLASTDVHEHALFVIRRALDAMGFLPLVAGAEMDPARIVKIATNESADAIVVATYNGMAFEVGKALRQHLDRANWRIPVFIGGKLNQVVGNEALPVDVSSDLAELGLVPCETIPELLRRMDDILAGVSDST